MDKKLTLRLSYNYDEDESLIFIFNCSEELYSHLKRLYDDNKIEAISLIKVNNNIKEEDANYIGTLTSLPDNILDAAMGEIRFYCNNYQHDEFKRPNIIVNNNEPDPIHFESPNVFKSEEDYKEFVKFINS